MHSQDIIYDTVYIEVIFLISYAPFYKTLKKKGVTTYLPNLQARGSAQYNSAYETW